MQIIRLRTKSIIEIYSYNFYKNIADTMIDLGGRMTEMKEISKLKILPNDSLSHLVKCVLLFCTIPLIFDLYISVGITYMIV